MSINRHACVSITCDAPDCANRVEGGWDEGAPHFECETEALAYTLGEDGCGWTRLPDGRFLCQSCAQSADCETTGHQWIEWRTNPHDADVEWRFCTHCSGAFEERLRGMSEGLGQ